MLYNNPHMKLKGIILLTILLLLSIGCGKDTSTDSEGQTRESSKQQTPPQPKVDPSEAKVVLRINHRQYTNKEFKQYIRVHYAGIAEDENEPGSRLISRLFDSFIEHKIISYVGNLDTIPIDQLEFNDFLTKLNTQDSGEPIDKTVISEAIKVQKFLYGKVYDRIKVSNKEIRNYYNSHIDDYRKKSEVLLHQILVKDREAAVKISGELKNYPRRFARLAREKSISIEARDGGLMGYFEEGTLPKDMENVVFSLAINTISPVVESSYGFHIFKITKKKRKRLLFLKRVEPEIKNILMAEKLRDAYKDFLEQSIQQLNIVVNHDALYVAYQRIPGTETNQTTDETTH
ncbi:MAG: peptidyl-prolyl cis-trans isomerase [bacterium]|nr:peptidyl-prolyl cis-trans isomerase [bacterium]